MEQQRSLCATAAKPSRIRGSSLQNKRGESPAWDTISITPCPAKQQLSVDKEAYTWMLSAQAVLVRQDL